ncbi:Transporter, ABC superfamily (Breast cancer resistance protein) [Handroanthus impetiginosus]|uniref:Transporter, ABC superfamily (Breast cancer resistance protein) n=1 Tax=Handroanthus impetiginosus TaxID=429701 RepID=A0A2G9HU79_9LAMI|nr:Transporter, ABC superfamily (Breast cancer resistance protein) [Handroanthus impetiginosus]
MELPVRAPVPGPRRVSYRIETKNLSYSFQSPYDEFSWIFKSPKTSPRFIINNVNLEARPGEITAIAGPSGAGKTTLLEILAGKIPPRKVSGQILINGHPTHSEIFPRLSGYVTQDDALFPLLTVEETLRYNALLRLPDGKRVASPRVKSLMKDLGLDHIAGSRVGQGSNHGISGGERRRLSIGVELVHDPTILFIDEPTSGLDSASALHIMSLLRLMAVNRGKTVILTIHQPGFRILELFDRLILLSNGRILHNGSLQLLQDKLEHAGNHIPSHINVLEFAIEIINIQTSDSRDSRAEENSPKISSSISTGKTYPCNSYTNSHFQEVVILGERFSKNIFRTKELFATRVIQALLVGSVLGTVYMNVNDDQGKVSLQTKLGFFAFSLSFLLSSTTEGLPIFLQERRIFTRETLRGAYRVSSYVTANTIVFFPFLLIVSLLYSTPAYFLVGLRRDIDGFLYFALVVWMVVLMSNSFTAFCSALVPNFIMGTSVIAGLMGSFFLFSGYFIAQENIPAYWIFMHYLSLFKYPFESLMINEYGGKGSRKCLENVGGECAMYGNEYLREQGLKQSQKWSNLAVMLCFVFGYRVLCFLVLWYRSYTTRK